MSVSPDDGAIVHRAEAFAPVESEVGVGLGSSHFPRKPEPHSRKKLDNPDRTLDIECSRAYAFSRRTG